MEGVGPAVHRVEPEQVLGQGRFGEFRSHREADQSEQAEDKASDRGVEAGEGRAVHDPIVAPPATGRGKPFRTLGRNGRVLPPPGGRDRSLLLELRAPDLSRLHDSHSGWDEVPRMFPGEDQGRNGADRGRRRWVPGHQGPDRSLRPRLPLRDRNRDWRDIPWVQFGDLRLRPEGDLRRRRSVVPADHQRVPTRVDLPPRLQHDRPVLPREDPRAFDRDPEVRLDLLRLDARRLVRSPAPLGQPGQHSRGLRGRLRHLRRDFRDRQGSRPQPHSPRDRGDPRDQPPADLHRLWDKHWGTPRWVGRRGSLRPYRHRRRTGPSGQLARAGRVRLVRCRSPGFGCRRGGRLRATPTGGDHRPRRRIAPPGRADGRLARVQGNFGKEG